MHANRHRWVKGGVALLAAALMTGLGGVQETVARPGAQPPDLSSVALSTTVFRERDTVTMSGTGCIDAETGSGTGLVAVLRRPIDGGRGGVGQIAMIQADVAVDGSFSGRGTVQQPLFPVGPQTATITCEPPPGDPLAPPAGPAVASRTMSIEVVASLLPPLRLTVGSQAQVELPCDVPQSSYGAFTISWPDAGQASGTLALSVPGADPPAAPPSTGDTVTFDVPGDATPGSHAAEARCGISEGGTTAYYRLQVTVQERVGATPAAPLPAEPRYTG